MPMLYLDLETYSEVPIQHGTHRYAASAEILLFAWAIDDGAVGVVDEANGQARPPELLDALSDPSVLVTAHNSAFDRTVLRHTGTDIALARWRDTMVKAMTHSLPGGLDSLCKILKIPTDKAKDKAGRQLIHLFCKPRPISHKLGRALQSTHPEEWAKFKAYAALDVAAMRAVDRALPNWNWTRQEIARWHLDQTINDRGVQIDIELVHAAITTMARAQSVLSARTNELTNGAVKAATQRDALLEHLLAQYGVELPDMQKATLERRVNDPQLPLAMRELIAIRLEASTSSTSKYKVLQRSTSEDGRLRGTLQFRGASRTGRWAGRLFQPQNLKRQTLNQSDIELAIDALKSNCLDLL